MFCGYVYRKEASFKNSDNWICALGNGKLASSPNKCRARCITRSDGSLKLGKYSHSHSPQKSPAMNRISIRPEPEMLISIMK